VSRPRLAERLASLNEQPVIDDEVAAQTRTGSAGGIPWLCKERTRGQLAASDRFRQASSGS